MAANTAAMASDASRVAASSEQLLEALQQQQALLQQQQAALEKAVESVQVSGGVCCLAGQRQAPVCFTAVLSMDFLTLAFPPSHVCRPWRVRAHHHLWA